LTGQRFPLDRLRPLSYIGACVVLAACPRPLTPLVPLPLAPASRDSAVAWSRELMPRGSAAIRFRWRFRDERVSYAGRGTAWVAPPDSLRFDYAGPLGLGSGAAVVLADSVLWADPRGDFESLIPAIPLLWSALGMVRPPADDAAVFGEVQRGNAAAGGPSGGSAAAAVGPERVVWRFARGADTLDYVATAGAPRTLEAEWRREGVIVARSRTEYDAQAMPASARIDFPEASARFELSVVAVDTSAVLAPRLWRGRR
jgi:hypothetical protein